MSREDEMGAEDSAFEEWWAALLQGATHGLPGLYDGARAAWFSALLWRSRQYKKGLVTDANDESERAHAALRKEQD